MHDQLSEHAGKTVKIKSGHFEGNLFEIEDWWDHMTGKSWMFSDNNPACLDYAIRSAKDGLITDNEVLYGKIGAMGTLIHISQLDLEDES